ncbi:8dfeec6f-0720-4821-a050-59e1591ba690 [Thermothielavioides terrestris]|uniref:8dfeec6f-0720-4821-a050-59e1591ba690 n=1 Tax=Thermothielavioides terrestris TaxID=2587410 RepID=A0A446BN86_9PEZI|nr:8dfeec6f-0720-4821-a050-59e1591ba690 [Thermothielavioides terrestris]
MAEKKRKAPGWTAEAGSGAGTGPGIGADVQAAAPLGGPQAGLPNPGAQPRRPAPGVHADGYFRRLYSAEPDFKQLAKQDPRFAAVLQDNGQLDFGDPAATMQLTKTLLQIDFGLKLELPHDRLCPPVPNRHNYILWLKDLMDTTSYEQPGRKLCGLDVGTGASCIYPLLGTVQRPWCFLATDIDAQNLDYAKRNIQLNGLEDRIRLLERKPEDALVPLDESGVQSIDFVMMNPPFYTSEDEMLSSARKKSRPPMSACTGAPVEMVCEGGEVGHVGRLLRESLVLRDRIQWYTSMLGKLTSLEVLVEQLRENGIDNYAVTEFVQGNKTRRWALGWSFGPMRPAERVARGMKANIWKKILPRSVTMELLVLSPDKPVGPVVARINDVPSGPARFTAQNKSTHERLSTNTVGLVALSDFRKRRAEVLEQQEREAREAALAARTSATSTPDRSLTATPNNASAESSEAERQRAKKKKRTKALVSFGGDEEEEEDSSGSQLTAARGLQKKKEEGKESDKDGGEANRAGATGTESSSGDDKEKRPAKVPVNTSVGIVPRALTKAALRREAAEREALRKEFLLLQAAVKATEIAIPFVFYDGTNIPGGVVRVKKGDFVWLFLDKSRKVGAQLGVGADKSANARRDWARVSVDDLLLVRGTMIIPHHYDFYFFIINKTVGPGNKRLFDYSAEAPSTGSGQAGADAAGTVNRAPPPLSELEGASDDPTFTKVVDRRWFQRNKHIYPANVWQEFDPEKDYSKEIRRDPGGNALFFSK